MSEFYSHFIPRFQNNSVSKVLNMSTDVGFQFLCPDEKGLVL